MSELPIKATLKAGGGYDAPWLTVDANDPNDLAFKLRALIEHESALTLVVEAANALKAHNSAAPIEAPQGAPAQQEQPKQQGWGQGQPAAQQGAPQQRQHSNKYGGAPHPEGKTCEACPNVLEKKTTSSGKAVWRCPDWRWNSGNPNGHSNEFID